MIGTPLSRILNEQIRPQLDRGWASAKSPDCTGIEVAELARVGWSRVDLTGSGSALDIDGVREDAAERSTLRSEVPDSDAARRDAEMELWDTTLPALP